MDPKDPGREIVVDPVKEPVPTEEPSREPDEQPVETPEREPVWIALGTRAALRASWS